MRIVRMGNLYPPYIVGGNEMLNRDITENLRQRGHEVHILTAHGEAFRDDPYIHQVFNYSLDEKDDLFLGGRALTPWELFRHHVFDQRTYQAVKRTLHELHPDLIVVHNLYMASSAPLLAARDIPAPIVAEVADKWLLFNLLDWGLVVHPTRKWHKVVVDGVRRWIQHPLARKVRLNGISTVSNFIKSLYVQAGFPEEIIETHYLGIHTDVFKPGPEHPLHHPVRLLFVGGLWEGKGIQVIIEAMQRLARMPNLPPFHLDVYGDGSEGFKAHLRELIREAGLESSITFHGFVAWETLVQAMYDADIFVFASIWDEPFAITPLQALGCGLPVVATTAGGTAEGYTDEETALLIPPNDAEAMAQAIARLVQDDALRHRLRERGLQDVQRRWRFDAYVDRLLDFYARATERWKKGQNFSLKSL